MKKIYLLQVISACVLLLTANSSFCQSTNISSAYWNSVSESELVSVNGGNIQIQTLKADYYLLGFQSVYQQLLDAEEGLEISLPMENGDFKDFLVVENSTMAEGLKANYPGIHSFNIISTESRSIWGKMEISHKGFRSMIFRPGKSTLFIDPAFINETAAYVVYQKKDFVTDKQSECQVTSEQQDVRHFGESAKAGLDYNDCELNTYRLAVAATGEYTSFHGGEVEDALSAQVTTMNRVNGVYERDFSVTFTIIANNDEIVYTNAATDPYTNGNPGAMINENQINLNSVIGAANYDVGHVFGTNSGGLAGLGVTCNNSAKARGVTGSAAPINDPFDIDYVAHELGHQFGGRHSFNNSCNGNRSDATAVEPGSGSTIMAYAGICSPNIQNNSDDHFHGINMREMGIRIQNDGCPEITPLDNSSPVLGELEEEIYIPVGTPFVLTVEGTDVDGDDLTYCWEQMDNETGFTQPPSAQSAGGPNFRSNSPVTSPSRYFPSLEILANNGPYTWERLPDVEREMNFRITARDNAPGGGCTQYDDMTVVTVGEDPFKVVYPSAIGIQWDAFTIETILWDVSNTTELPIDAQTVDIFLSIDGGVNYDIQLADDTENDGEFIIEVPNIATTDAYIMVMNSAGTFFDISNNDFTINAIDNGFYFSTDFIGTEVCQGEGYSFDLELMAAGTYDETVNIQAIETPGFSSVEFSQTSAQIGDVVSVTVTTPVNLDSDEYLLTIEGTDGDFTNSISFNISVIDAIPIAATPVNPENGAEAIPTFTALTWEDNATVGMTYTVELATDEAFANIVFTESELTNPNVEVADLASETTYFWRITNVTSCGTSSPSEVFSFSTFVCQIDASMDVPMNIPDEQPGEIESTLDITEQGIIAEVNVLNVNGTHSLVSDLKFTIESPQGTEVVLVSGICGLNMTIESDGDVVVSYPESVADTYASSGAANFGANIPPAGVSGNLVQALDGTGTPELLCDPAVNGEELDGKIALISRGGCTFVNKVLNAQEAGAIAVIVANNIPGDGFFDMGGDSDEIDIPAIMVSYEDGQILASGLGGDSEGFSFGFSDLADASEIPCPATDGGTYQPFESLSTFEGENAAGTWKLKITDSSAENGGELQGWDLQICYTNDNVESVQNINDLAVSIFPNPTNGQVTIELEELIQSNISLVDISGRVIERIHVKQVRTELDMTSLANGVYFIHVQSEGNGRAVHKIVKQ